MNIEITAARATMNGTRVIKLQITRPSIPSSVDGGGNYVPAVVRKRCIAPVASPYGVVGFFLYLSFLAYSLLHTLAPAGRGCRAFLAL